MISKIKNIKRSGLPVVNFGKAENATDFFNQVVKDQFANKEAIKAIHSSLIEYVNLDSAVYVLRLYGSASKKKYELLRRGFLSQYPDGNKIVFCDNTFAMPFAAMKINGIAYSPEELLGYMNNPNLQCGFGSTREERELAFYKYDGQSRINMNSAGWYLAHIEPVGYNYKSGMSLSKVFPRPDRKLWINSANHLRISNTDLTNTEIAILKAHFLRMVHPLNSFLVPKRSMVIYESGNNLGEEEKLISTVRDFIKREFKNEYNELKDLMQIPEEDNAASLVDTGKIIWSSSPSNFKSKNSVIKTVKKNTSTHNRNTQTDPYNTDMEEHLERTLRSIGKGAFLKIYPIVKENPNATIEDICVIYPEYGKYKLNSQRGRLSSTRSIVNNDLGADALEIIMNSSHIKEEERKLALKLRQQL